jgi:hypothetical protein
MDATRRRVQYHTRNVNVAKFRHDCSIQRQADLSVGLFVFGASLVISDNVDVNSH